MSEGTELLALLSSQRIYRTYNTIRYALFELL